MKDSLSQGYYVYELAYPESMGGAVFYVGKGSGSRIDQHETESRKGHQCQKCDIIRQIETTGERIVKRKIYETFDEQDAYHQEVARIRKYGLHTLANRVDTTAGAPMGNQNAVGHKGYVRTDLAGNQYAKKEYTRLTVSLSGEIVTNLAEQFAEAGIANLSNAQIKQYALHIIKSLASDEELFDEFSQTRKTDAQPP